MHNPSIFHSKACTNLKVEKLLRYTAHETIEDVVGERARRCATCSRGRLAGWMLGSRDKSKEEFATDDNGGCSENSSIAPAEIISPRRSSMTS